jgi:argininosuccinate lyase
MPLGAGAVTATSLPIKREMVAAELGFGAISQNSMDAVSDRDFVVEIEAALALVMVHLSRLAEEIVLWATSEFDFIELPDDYATGSSLMPQKKNPDVAELVRGRTGGVFGALQAMLTTLKGLPLSYNRDLQEDKEGFFTAVDTALQSLDIMARMLSRVRFEVASMERAASDPALLATELAEYLVRKDVPFREAHEVVGRAVKRAASKKLAISSLTGEQWRSLHPAFGDDVEKLFDVHRAVSRREVPGSPGPRAIKRALLRGVLAVKRNQEWLKENATA